MEPETKLQQTVKRILATNWDVDYSQSEYHVQLVREYHRRVALWTIALDCKDIENWPFFDIAYKIEPTVRANNHIIEKVGKHLWDNNRLGEPLRKICIWTLHWNALLDTNPEEIAKFRLPTAYEPMIVAYETGIGIAYDHGFALKIGSRGIGRHNWQHYYKSESYVQLPD